LPKTAFTQSFVHPREAEQPRDKVSLSDGTRDQLFLALRLAYIENHCATAGPCPVILDDVLMAFDDDRAAAALRALEALSHKTQVLLFTHHQHHVALADNTLGRNRYRLHELQAPSRLAA